MRNLKIFRFVTVPASLVSLGVGIAAAETLSPDLMYAAAGIGAFGALAFLVAKRNGWQKSTQNGHSNDTTATSSSNRSVAARGLVAH